jgi:hypothetical protein
MMEQVLKSKKKHVIIAVVLISLLYLNPKILYVNKALNENDQIRLSQTLVNFTVESDYTRLIWLEFQVTLKITSNVSGLISCYIASIDLAESFTMQNNSAILIGNNTTQSIILRSFPSFFTMPGIYKLALNITGVIEYNESLKVSLGCGFISMVALIGSLILVICIVFIKRKNAVDKKEKELYEESDKVKKPLLPNKIKCPKCNEIIDEGLIFCPECGERIPEFLRYYSPPS